MKLFASLLLAIAVALNGPSFCAHAAASSDTSAAHDHMAANMSADGGMDCHKSDGEPAPPAEQDDHCPEGCDGGDGCSACGAFFSAILSQSVAGLQPAPDIVQTQPANWLTQQALHIDPPPPKHLS